MKKYYKICQHRKKGTLLFLPMVPVVALSSLNAPIFIEPNYDVVEIGAAAKKCLDLSYDKPKEEKPDIFDIKTLKGVKSWPEFTRVWGSIDLTLDLEKGYSFIYWKKSPTKRNGVLVPFDQPELDLELNVSDVEIGGNILTWLRSVFGGSNCWLYSIICP